MDLKLTRVNEYNFEFEKRVRLYRMKKSLEEMKADRENRTLLETPEKKN